MTSLPGHRPQKTATLLAQRIVAEITEREVAPGQTLPSEREMLEEYRVARGTLREALRFLEMQGVLSMKPGPGGGPVVNSPDSRSLASAIALLLERSHVRYRAVFEARKVLEPEMASMAAERADPADIVAMEACVKAMRDSITDLRAFLSENHVFHSVIGRASGNRLFDYLLSSLSSITDATILGVDYPEKHRHTVLGAHERIYQRICERDTAGAADEMRSHIVNFGWYLDRYYPHILDQPLRWEQVMQ